MLLRCGTAISFAPPSHETYIHIIVVAGGSCQRTAAAPYPAATGQLAAATNHPGKSKY